MKKQRRPTKAAPETEGASAPERGKFLDCQRLAVFFCGFFSQNLEETFKRVLSSPMSSFRTMPKNRYLSDASCCYKDKISHHSNTI